MFTVDHGEMLGERGMWFKLKPYEPSIKVPLIVHLPGAPAARRVTENCSLVDLLPTLLDLATDGQPPELADTIDGHSLSPLLRQSAKRRRAVASPWRPRADSQSCWRWPFCRAGVAA